MSLYDVLEEKRNQILRESITSEEFLDFHEEKHGAV